jgi:putative hydrolase of the HAD superfamily
MNSLQHIQAVTFDAGGTLITPWPSVGHVYADVAAEQGLKDISPALLNERFSAAWRRLHNFHHGPGEWAALVDEVFAGLSPKPPSESFFPELFQRFADPSAWRIFDDVKPTLDALATHGLNLAVISNWDERLGPLLEALGLRQYFETVVISREIGFAKPSPVIFEHASRKLGLAPEFILHVGDSLHDDVAGARAAGFAARLLARADDSPGADAVRSLGELAGLLTGQSCPMA